MTEIDRVLSQRPVVLAIDLRGLSFMDSSGVHVLDLRPAGAARSSGQRFFVIRGGRHIDRLLTACGLDGYFEMVAGPISCPTARSLASGRSQPPGAARAELVHSDA